MELAQHALPVGDSGMEIPVFVLEGESYFTSTHALWADEFDPPASPHGALVAIPSRHTVVAHPIRHGGAIHTLAHLLELGQRLSRGPGALTEAVYWLRDGELERLDAWVDDEGAHFAPSERFTSVMRELG